MCVNSLKPKEIIVNISAVWLRLFGRFAKFITNMIAVPSKVSGSILSP